ncbi:reductive dehalogenase [Dehalococcoides mccartyi]|uniref:Reductive dehalogenase n=1 Tax=Dehalococcoides mccartyi (strain VS) TaxID=311424 RepID=D2BJB9_DEHMV|nr:reductive dehalogenase [Dehalococcoides mccartyi]ACZ62419.1 reductive dehalogenase [Dehalococcoides mccartyi VS]
MSKFHNTVSRRDFMKVLGLTGAGLGAISATAPVFHDLDELLSSEQAKLNRSWYVKPRESGDFGVEIDWDVMKRRNQSRFSNWHMDITAKDYPGGPTAFNEAIPNGVEAVKKKTKELWPNLKTTIRDWSLDSSLLSVGVLSHYSLGLEMGLVNLVNPSRTPEELGMPKWEGTPEENLMMVRAVLSVVGMGPSVGSAELDDKNINFIWGHAPVSCNGLVPAERIIFDDSITEYYRTKSAPYELHIPSSHKYVIATNNMSADERLRRPMGGVFTGFPAGAEMISYSRVSLAKSFMEQFMHGIGYHAVHGYKLQAGNAWGICTGVGEHSRMGTVIMSPEYGALLRTHAVFYTDLPLAPTPAIDAGITKFCETCGICAEACPMGSISPRGVGQSWDNACGQDWADNWEEGGTQTMYNLPGYKGWRNNAFKCTVGSLSSCGAACKGSCPFNTIPDGSFMHSIVKATVATTPVFNSFFRNMEETMRYGYLDKEPSSWWNSPEEWNVYGTHPNLLKQ